MFLSNIELSRKQLGNETSTAEAKRLPFQAFLL